MEDYHEKICNCCHAPFEVKQLSYWKSSLADIGKVSPRLQEYFQILIFFMIVFIILFAFTGVTQIVYNKSIVTCMFFQCSSEDRSNIHEYYSKLGDTEDFKAFSAEIMMLISLILIFILKTLFYGYLLRQKQRNEGELTISHYSVHAENLKSSKIDDIKKAVVKDFKESFRIGKEKDLEMKEEDILYVSRFRNLRGMHNLIKRFMTLSKKRKILKIKYKDRKKFDIKRKKSTYKFKVKPGKGSAQDIDIKDLIGDNPIFEKFDIIETENRPDSPGRRDRGQTLDNEPGFKKNETDVRALDYRSSQEDILIQLSPPNESKFKHTDPLTRKSNQSPGQNLGLPQDRNEIIESPLITINNISRLELEKKIKNQSSETGPGNIFQNNNSENNNSENNNHEDHNLLDSPKSIPGLIKSNTNTKKQENTNENGEMSKMYDKKEKHWVEREDKETMMDKKYKEKDKKLEEELKKVIDKLTRLRTDKSKMLNEAIITFNRVELATAMVTNKWKRITSEYMGYGATFYKEANKPLDIIWQNYHDSRSSRRIKIILFFFIAIGMIACKSLL